MTDYKDIFNARGHLYNEATMMCPGAREAERITLINLLKPKAGETIIDVPAGGGYLADGIRKQFGDEVIVICVEPAEQFSKAIDPFFRVILEPADAVTSLEDKSLDAVASLAGLHHIADKRPIYREWHRLLRPDGRIAVADVASNTGTADFLNIFVDEFVPGGHNGMFFAEDEWIEQLTECGFSHVEEELRSIPWVYDSEDQMIDFCISLFSLQKASREQVREAIRHYIGVESENNGSVRMMWQLRYARAEKAG